MAVWFTMWGKMNAKPADPSVTLPSDYEPSFGIFHDLMKFRVREILLVSSFYDAFVLEEDGRLSEKIFSEYLDLNLRFVPRIHRVSSAEEALTALRKGSFDLVITMIRISDMDVIEFGKMVKEVEPDLPVILLTYEWLELDFFSKLQRSAHIDKVFYWSGDTRILLAIIKYVEDLKNVSNDSELGVRVILILEDSPKFYSAYLPGIYTEIMTQTRMLITEGVNDLHRLLRMRARPKILMSETYEDGLELYGKYKSNLLGIISDVEFPREGRRHDMAGFHFARMVREEIPDLPILLQSANEANKQQAVSEGLNFLNKNSENLLHELSQFILSNFGFGDFVFRYPDGREIGRARNLREFVKLVEIVPVESLEFHARRNHISIWLRARTEFAMAEQLRPKKVSDFKDIDALRAFIRSSIRRLIALNQSGVIADFESANFDYQHAFVRIGNGSLGGKARGLAFLNTLLAKISRHEAFEGVDLKIPHTFVICSEVFEAFVQSNGLQEFAIQESDNESIARAFTAADLPEKIVQELKTLIQHIRYPLAVRSSSLLEDSQMLPFAGLYSTYMLPNNHEDTNVRLKQLCMAIKLVFASVYYKSPKEYVRNTNFRIEEEKMAVIVQQIAGRNYGGRFYPVMSGVAQSYNYYPISHLRPEDGIVQLALGLGTVIVEGAQTHRFSPRYPEMNPPYASPSEWVKNSQNYFYALGLEDPGAEIVRDEKFSLLKLNLSEAETDGTLFYAGSTFSPQDNAIRDSLAVKGPRLVTFANILKHDVFPLTPILREILRVGREAFGAHIELEFAVNLERNSTRGPEFFLLQIRPMVAGQESVDIAWEEVGEEEIACVSRHAMGNGVFEGLCDIVYVDPDAFDVSKTRQIALEVGKINQRFIDENRRYVLIGFGRWGTADPWLGIPVEWFQISKARVIVESNLGHFVVDPSQGSHFFHNLISLKMGYFHIGKHTSREFVAWPWLKDKKPFFSGTYVHHLRLAEPLRIRVNGRKSEGVILKP